MREKKYYIAFDGYERGVMVNALNEMRNALLQQGRYTAKCYTIICSQAAN